MYSGKYTGFAILGLSIVMMLDASIAFVFGERYMYWGLDYMPAWYRSFVVKIYKSPRPVLWLYMIFILHLSPPFPLVTLMPSMDNFYYPE